MHLFSHPLGHGNSRSNLNDLLVPPLDCTVALEQVGDIAMLVSQDLNLDVFRARQELLDKDRIHAERVLCFKSCLEK